jgi:3-phenylpropionate/trans-cinnamate dioxygenase ferredoxin reductase subunit
MSPSAPFSNVVVVGAGQAAAELAGQLRGYKYAGSITLIGDEHYLPYRRPPLSKSFLAGEASVESLLIKPLQAYQKQQVDCRVGIRVEAVDRTARQLRLSDGSRLGYEHLVLATGGRARRLELPGSTAAEVHYIRSIEGMQALQGRLAPGRHLAVIGGGYIGLESAAVAAKLGLRVTVLEGMPRILARVTAPEMSAFYERAHRRRGVEIRTGAVLERLEADAGGTRLQLAGGESLWADLVVAGIGLVPATELAQASGLQVSNGIVTGADTRTEDPAIFAIGDCANHYNDFFGRHVRLESVPGAVDQARLCAAAICGVAPPALLAPWFWSDQYELKLQMVGLSQHYDTWVARGDMESESFCSIYLKDGRLAAMDAVNRPQDFLAAKKLVGAALAGSVDELRDPATPLASLFSGHAAVLSPTSAAH